MVCDPSAGKYRRARLFVFTLGHSRKSVRLLIGRSSSRASAELHERAFRRLGGAPRVVVLDDLREGVVKADIYDPHAQPLYADVLKHYGVVGLPCRMGDPDRNGKVESGVGHAQKASLGDVCFEVLGGATIAGCGSVDASSHHSRRVASTIINQARASSSVSPMITCGANTSLITSRR